MGDPQPRSVGSRHVAHEVIDSGSFGAVWRGEGPDGPVAIKLLHEDLASDPCIVRRFLEERDVLTGLDHPNIVGVRDLVVDGADLALVMDLVDGVDLRSDLSVRGAYRSAEAVSLMADVADALAAAHADGVVHRDVKPENILIETDGRRPLLADFGVARLAASPQRTRATGGVGTPDYMAPEVVSGGDAGPAADVYAAGTILYELLAGSTPFGGDNPVLVLRRQVTEPVPALPAWLGPEQLKPLGALLVDCLAKSPEARPSAGELAQRLRMLPEVAAGPEPTPAVATSGQPTGRKKTSWRLQVLWSHLTSGSTEQPVDQAPAAQASSAAGDEESRDVVPDESASPPPSQQSPSSGHPRHHLLAATAAAVVVALVMGGTAIGVALTYRGPDAAGGDAQPKNIVVSTGEEAPTPDAVREQATRTASPPQAGKTGLPSQTETAWSCDPIPQSVSDAGVRATYQACIKAERGRVLGKLRVRYRRGGQPASVSVALIDASSGAVSRRRTCKLSRPADTYVCELRPTATVTGSAPTGTYYVRGRLETGDLKHELSRSPAHEG